MLLNEKQVAELLCCTKSALRRWRREGRGPRFVKIGRLVRYRQEDVEDFINESAVATQVLADNVFGGAQ